MEKILTTDIKSTPSLSAMESGKYIPNCKEQKANEIESFSSTGTQGRFLETVFVARYFFWV